MTERKQLLEKLLAFDGVLPEIERSLHAFGWDSDKPLVTLRREHVISLLRQYIQSQITEKDVEYWANLIENREDIGFEKGYDALLHDVIFELANPLLTHKLDRPTAQRHMDKLG